ncbi:MAG TPA: hypothetical protein VGR21_10990, partial [Cryptosporangiaceae bacterium]|nr:hypothetical protein [Cryptosporangiaceae bacterium]
MSHMPVDHRLRGVYRGLAFVVGAAMLGFGTAAYVQTSGRPFFDQNGETLLGVTANPAFALFSAVLGAIVLVGLLIGRNVDARLNVCVGVLLMVAGCAQLILIPTDANVLASTVTNVNVQFMLGLILLIAGLYGATARAPRVTLPGSAADTTGHPSEQQSVRSE